MSTFRAADANFCPRPAQCWRVSAKSRIAACALALISATFFGFVGMISNFPLLVFLSFAVPAALTWRCAIHPKIELADTTIRLTNPVATHDFPLKDIVGVESGYSGIAIRLRGGRKRTAWAVQQSNAALFLGRQTRSDQVVRKIRKAALNGGAALQNLDR